MKKIKKLITSKIKNLNNHDEKYMKIRFHSDDDLTLKKMLVLFNIAIVVKFVFHKDNIC